MMRTANPALNATTFSNLTNTPGEVMTIGGTVNKTALCLFLLFGTASWSWAKAMQDQIAPGLFMFGLIGSLIAAIATIFKKTWAPVTTPIYALLEGVLLGAISALFERMYPGIVFQAITLTFGTLFALLLAYKSGLIRATENFKLGIFAATGAIAVVYLINFVMSFFGASIPMIHQSGTVGIIFSCIVVVVAALNLVLDFDFIEHGAEAGAPKYMEWYGAFGLLVTLIWLYLEILRLLAKLNSRR